MISTESVNSQKKRCVDVGNLSLTDGGRFHVFTIFPTITTDNYFIIVPQSPYIVSLKKKKKNISIDCGFLAHGDEQR